MSPSADTILRRRHTAQTGLRVGVALCVTKAIWTLADALSGIDVFDPLSGVQLAFDNGLPILLWLGSGAALIAFERPLVRWLVPRVAGGHVCLNCGYSLKNLRSPICPECGTDIGPRMK